MLSLSVMKKTIKLFVKSKCNKCFVAMNRQLSLRVINVLKLCIALLSQSLMKDLHL